MGGPGVERNLAGERVESLRRRLAAGSDLPQLRFSVGISNLVSGGRPEDALHAADQLMYEAKAKDAS